MLVHLLKRSHSGLIPVTADAKEHDAQRQSRGCSSPAGLLMYKLSRRQRLLEALPKAQGCCLRPQWVSTACQWGSLIAANELSGTSPGRFDGTTGLGKPLCGACDLHDSKNVATECHTACLNDSTAAFLRKPRP